MKNLEEQIKQWNDENEFEKMRRGDRGGTGGGTRI